MHCLWPCWDSALALPACSISDVSLSCRERSSFKQINLIFVRRLTLHISATCRSFHSWPGPPCSRWWRPRRCAPPAPRRWAPPRPAASQAASAPPAPASWGRPRAASPAPPPTSSDTRPGGWWCSSGQSLCRRGNTSPAWCGVTCRLCYLIIEVSCSCYSAGMQLINVSIDN